jgi:hypothetical protein
LSNEDIGAAASGAAAGSKFAVQPGFFDPFSKSAALQSVLDACGQNLDPKVKEELEYLGRQFCHWTDRLRMSQRHVAELIRKAREYEACCDKASATLAKILARVELLRGVSFVVDRYSEAPAGDEPTPLSFRVKADFGPTH